MSNQGSNSGEEAFWFYKEKQPQTGTAWGIWAVSKTNYIEKRNLRKIYILREKALQRLVASTGYRQRRAAAVRRQAPNAVCYVSVEDERIHVGILPDTTQLNFAALTNLPPGLRMIIVYTIAASENPLVACTRSLCEHKRRGIEQYQAAG